MQKVLTLYETTVGKKAVMAVTGLLLMGFVVGHMLGNLQVYFGPEQLNSYAEKLKQLGPLLWAVRAALLSALLVHLTAAAQLVWGTWGARGIGYRKFTNQATTYAAMTMKYTGPLILLFVGYHLAHFTYPGIAMGNGYEHSPTDVYANVVNGFSVPLVAALYVAAQIALGFHIYHGGWSLLHTLGVDHPRYNERLRTWAKRLAVVVVLGNVSIPVAVVAGFVN
jgi:succinate dehydrogenase / fumarate reductase cytochrome b subunit